MESSTSFAIQGLLNLSQELALCPQLTVSTGASSIVEILLCYRDRYWQRWRCCNYNGGDATETGGVVSILSGPSLSTTSGALAFYQ